MGHQCTLFVLVHKQKEQDGNHFRDRQTLRTSSIGTEIERRDAVRDQPVVGLDDVDLNGAQVAPGANDPRPRDQVGSS